MDKLRRFLSLFLVLCMVATVLPVSAVTAAAEQSDDPVTDGLITENGGMTVTATNGKNNKNTWTKAEGVTHDDHTVYMGKKGAKLSITTNQKCYVVFDYTLIDSAPATAKTFVYGPTNGGTYATVSDLYLRIIPIDSADASSTTWHTGVVDCTNETYKTAQFEIKNSDTTTVYISNIRIFGENNLPDTCKAHVTFEFAQEHGTLSGYILRNGHVSAGHLIDFSNETTTFDVPIDSLIRSAKFTTNPGANFVAFKITDPQGQETSDIINYTFTNTGNYTIKVVSDKAADAAEVQVFGKDGAELTAKGQTDYGDLYVQKTEDTEWKIQLTKGEKQYDSVTVTDNGSAVSLTPGEGNVSYYVPPTDGEVHEIKIVYSQADCADTTQNVVLWNTLDFKDAFGDNNGLKDDFWKGAPDALSKWTAVDEKNGKSGGTKYNLMYDPNPPMGKDENHQIIFSSRRSSYSDMYNYENVFTFDKAGLFSFDYAIANEKNEDNKYDDSRYTFYALYTPKTGKGSNVVNITSGISGWQHVQAEVEAGSTITISFLDEAHVGTWLGLSNISFLSEKVKLTVETEGQGTVKGGGVHYKGQSVTLEATPSDNFAFVGWYEGERLLSTESVIPYTLDEPVTLKAKFVEVQDKVAQIGDQFFDSLDAAFAAAKTMEGNTVVRLLGTAYSLKENFTVPAGETLLLPCSIGDTGYSPVTGFNPDGTTTGARVGKAGEVYFTFTIPKDVTLTVEGTVLVNAVTGRPQAGHLDMDVNGGYAQIDLEGNILVKSGGVLDVCGYVKDSASGTGTITAEQGGEVRDLYIVRNWRGGSQAFAMFPKVYPMNEVDMHNIEVKTVIHAGAKFVGTVKMYASGSYYYTRFPQVDQANGLIQQESGTVTRTYKDGIETWVLDGKGEISSSILNIVGMDLSTGSFLYPIDGDMIFDVKGDWTVVERLKFMPGAKVNLLEGGTLTLAEKTKRYSEGNEIVFYPDFQTADPDNTSTTEYPTNRDHAQLTIYGGTTTNVNCAFGGEVVVDPAATPANPAVIKFMAGKPVSVSSKEANYYYNDPKNGGQTMRELTFTATLGGYTVKSGETYTCYYEGDTLVIELAGEDKTQEAVYSGAAVAWTGGESVQYLVDGAWTADAPTNAGEYPVGVNIEGGGEGYKLVKRVGVLTIKPIAAEFAIEPKNVFEYDGEPKTVTVKVKNAKAEGEVTALTGADSRLTGTDKGTYTVTVTGLEGTGKDNYTIEGGTATLTWSIVAKPEATPDGLGTEFAGNITGLHEGENYKIDGTEVTAGADGKTPIQDAWFGRTVDVVKSGDGVNTSDSAAAHLEIPARPEAPAASPSQASGASATDGSITVTVKDGESYEYRKSAAETWTEVPEDGKIGGLSYGDYEVRVKGTETSFPGAAQKVTVSYYMPVLPSTSSQTTTNPDGSTTTTTTKPDGTKTETTTKTDGTVTEKTTKTDGSVSEKTTQTDGTVTEKNTEKSGVVTETTTKPDNTVTEKVTQTDGSATEKTTTPDGVVGQKSTDSEGKVTSAEVVIPKEAEKQDVVTAPVEVPAAKTAEEAPEISVRTESTESKKVEIPVTEFGPGTVAVIVHEDGTEEVVRDCTIGENGVVLNVEGDVTLKIIDKSETFEDVEEANHWASDAVEFVAARELFNGTGENTFTPNGSMTRGMMVTVLYRLAYEPDAVEEGFADVPSGQYYSDAVAWAAENGVVNGYDNNTFAPDDNVSREQLVTILHRYAQKKGYATNASGTLANFADATSVSSWASDAMSWAVELGLVNGTDASHISPAKSATRAEVATILMRFCEKVVK